MKKSNLKIIFWGTHKFAISIFESLVKNDYLLIGLITVPDKPTGRKKIVTPPPLKSVALKHKIKIFQPDKLKDNKDFFEKFKEINPEICIVAGYGKLIPKEYLDMPRFGFLNIHPSILPKYRGPTPIQTAILNGERETGISIILMDREMDHGPILASKNLKIPIKEDNDGFKFILSYKELEEKLSKLAAEVLLKILPKLTNEEIKPKPQNHRKATYTRKFSWQDGKIDWKQPAKNIALLVSALNPEPGTWTEWNKKIIKILEVKYKEERNKKNFPGFVTLNENKEIIVESLNGLIKIEKLQLEGKRILSAKEFSNGYPDFINSRLD